MRETFLILSGNYGDGHQQAAKAIYEALQRMHPDIDGKLVDFMELAHPYAHPVSRYIFLQGVKKFPSAYGFLFKKSRDINHFSDLLKKMNRIGLRRLLSLIQRERPAMVVSTFPLAAGAMSMLKQYGLTNVPTATVITDHTYHSSWVHSYTDHYLVGSDYVKQRLIENGVPSYHISVTGIPIRREFAEVYHRERLLQKHGLVPSQPIILVMGGGCGIFDSGASLVESLEALPKTAQIVIVCGRNRKLEREFIQRAGQSKHRIQVKGYIDYVHELMAVADLMITKPGGLTISEALAMNLPMVLYKSIPGQEEDNADFLLQSGTAVAADTRPALIAQISKLLLCPEMLLAMRERADAIQKKNAAIDAVNVIMKIRREYQTDPLSEQWVPSLQT
jgi:processive 1,2-diacylglycerol beta-glucosyltransferase